MGSAFRWRTATKPIHSITARATTSICRCRPTQTVLAPKGRYRSRPSLCRSQARPQSCSRVSSASSASPEYFSAGQTSTATDAPFQPLAAIARWGSIGWTRALWRAQKEGRSWPEGVVQLDAELNSQEGMLTPNRMCIGKRCASRRFDSKDLSLDKGAHDCPFGHMPPAHGLPYAPVQC